ncbi:NAD-dependent epimerase/dehydratase family protein [Alteromonas sediminis]|uniref:NAD-dependent epimerase/dehydratase family protein n=1 Tax=Alteromonas sediminis TaxID=2259342 RepID=A0A3N5Y205_9ALTE|nr:NAD-dependent epimerase/dehydratase family protein [Alteromonas sediminis]RPJ66666.1 NAD-dependent epimerase/dehydratase family protein [Alteromonas sediminis]
MHVLVTGGTGFLGINVIQQCLDKGWSVTATHRKSSNVDALKTLSVALLEVDMLDRDNLITMFPEDIDVVFHIAGDTNMWTPNNDKQYQANVVATSNLVDAAIAKKVSRFIHTSSIAAYGFHDDIITEKTQSKALISSVNYIKTKFQGEQVVKTAVVEGKLDAVILNPCAIMGPHDRHNWSQLFTMIKHGTLPGVPAGEGSYCHVREVAAAHITAVEKGGKGENYILAGVDHAFLEVVSKIGVLVGKKTPSSAIPSWVLRAVARVQYWVSLITHKEPSMTPEKALMVTKRVAASSEKAVSELGYNDKVPIDDMLDDCYQWLKAEKLL